MRKIIFLDIDGVLNHNQYFMEMKSIGKRSDGTKLGFFKQHIDIISLLYLEDICKDYDTKIVISSTWRHNRTHKEIKESFKSAFDVDLPIIDSTPILGGLPRGLEIKKWLNDEGLNVYYWSKDQTRESMEKSNIEQYVILDDDSDMLYQQRNHFVHVLPYPRNDMGFRNAEYTNKVRKILSTDLINLNNIENY
mgnify:CR=1 FL=1